MTEHVNIEGTDNKDDICLVSFFYVLLSLAKPFSKYVVYIFQLMF